MTIEDTLKERGDRYGSFEHHAEIAQGLQDLMRAQPGWGRMVADQRQALTVIMDKVARMLNGDPAYRDNWHDIVGYAKLVDDRMARDESAARVALADASYDLGETSDDPMPVEVTILGDWQPWRGGSKPPCPNGSNVEVRFPEGNCSAGAAEDFNWRHVSTLSKERIIAWRYAQ